MQQQPPVADQEIAQMNEPAMPENVGIGALPAPVLAGMPAGGIAGEEEMEPQTMAGGGMVAFSGGGDVERYQSRGLVQDAARSAASDVESPAERARRLVRMAQARAGFSGPVPFTYGLTPGAAAAGLGVAGIPIGIAGGLTAAIEEMREQGYPVDQMGEFATEATPEQRAFDAARVAKTRALDTPAATAPAPGASQTPSPTDPNFRRLPDPRMAGITLPDLRSAAGAPAAPGAGPNAAPGAGPDAAPGAGAPPRAAGFDMTPAGLIALRKKLGEDINVEEPKNIREAREALNAEELAARQATKAAIERDQAKFAEAFKGREERLSKREEKINKQKDTDTGLAFLNAGLAIMSTPGGLATAIGKGARVGTEQYASGLEKLRAAQDKLDEARDRLDDLKLNRAEMSAKEIRDAEAGINTAKIAAKQRGVEALSNMYNISNKRADTMFNTLAEVGTTVYKEQQATARNAASVAAQERATAATREAAAAARLPALMESTRKNIAAEAVKKFPYDAAARERYETAALAEAIRSNPALAQYAGTIPGGGGGAAQLNPSDAALVQKYLTGG
jgi:hypothetical protein